MKRAVTKKSAPRRVGRPPASDSTATRARILRAARHTFSELGYASTTNKHLAAAADVTTGAIYHYFDSKRDLYRAVYEDTQTLVYDRLDEAVANTTSFVTGIEDVLDVSHQLNNTDPSLARFLAAVRIDVRRNPELDSMFGPINTRRDEFFEALIDLGIATGEIDSDDRARVLVLIRVILIGLVDAVSDDQATHRTAVEGIKRLIEGKLIRT
jgi:AcrR family transcriptional regulator